MIEVEAAGLSDPGPLRETNEDALGCHVPSDQTLHQRKGCLYALADGVGGHQAGEVASSTAIQVLIDEYYSPSNHGRVEPALHHAVQTANLRIHDAAQRNPELRSMATTLTALVLAGTHAYVAHVGDSRAYHWRAGRFTQLTADHSEAAELVRMRVVSRDRLRDHPRRNVLTRTLGSRLLLRPDFLRQSVEPGDQLLLCCDGVWAELKDEEMAEILGQHRPEAACRALIDRAIEREAADNVSVQIVRVNAVTPHADSAPTRNGWLATIFGRGGRQ